MQKDSRLFDDFSKMASGAAGMLLDVRREVEAAVMAQVEKLLARMNLVRREEFEIVRDMAAKAREEQEKLALRLEVLEKRQ
jgi:BMFP domain-containing protein YqiC